MLPLKPPLFFIDVPVAARRCARDVFKDLYKVAALAVADLFADLRHGQIGVGQQLFRLVDLVQHDIVAEVVARHRDVLGALEDVHAAGPVAGRAAQPALLEVVRAHGHVVRIVLDVHALHGALAEGAAGDLDVLPGRDAHAEARRGRVRVAARVLEEAPGDRHVADALALALLREVQLDGVGYGWTNATLRMAFTASAAIQYNQDFLMHGSTMYAYFRTRTLVSKDTIVTMVEQGGMIGTAVSALANTAAPGILEQQLQRGFTVIRDTNGTVDFAVGVVEKGKRPVKPFEVRDDDRVTLMNERTEVRGNQLDFLGPFHVDGSNGALFLTMMIDGTSALDVMVVDKNVGDQWLDRFVAQPGVPQPSLPPLVSEIVRQGMRWQKTLPLKKGYYYVVLDNSSVVGLAAPVATGSLPAAALANVVVQVGDAP